MKISFELNGKPVEGDIPVRTTLVDCIRHHFMQTGTHAGCEHGVCGACTVIVDGEAVRSCLMLAVQANGSKVTTVEGLTPAEGLSPLQASFRKHHALQCGFCTPGFLTASVALLEENPSPTELEVREWLSGNICRCTGYQFIVDAVLAAAAELREGRGAGTGSPA
jgi:carbon-monoxide dehydrogenase small subunit